MDDSISAAGEPFAAYLAKYYVGRKGYRTGTVPEATALAEACDVVLTLMDGITFQVICIVDRETHPQKTFGLSPEALDQIGQQCLKYAGTLSGNKMPITFQVMEVGGDHVTEKDRLRLGAFKRKSVFSKIILISWKLDLTAKTAWTNAPLGGFFVRRPIERLLRAPRVADADLRGPEIAVARERFPLITIVLLAVLAAAFGCELFYGIGPWSGLLAPSIQTLVALGGLNKSLVLQSGDWYRIFSATLLHSDALHLALNGFCLYLAGTVLESFVGRRWFFGLFVIGGVCGSLMSLAVNPSSVVSVGASGAIMGLLAAAFVCSFRQPAGARRTQIQATALQVLIPSLLPLAMSRTGHQVDFASHLGGALSGAIVGFAMLKTWSPTSSRPAFMPVATAVSVAGTLAFALSFMPLSRDYHSQALDALLIPNQQLPKSNTEAQMRATDLVARYPHDPRARLFRANVLIEGKDLPGAERELRTGLAEKEILKVKFKPDLEAQMGGMLALVLNDRSRPAEAKAVAQPVCETAKATFVPVRDLLVNAQLCEK